MFGDITRGHHVLILNILYRNMAAISRIKNSREKILLYAAIGILVYNRRKNIFKKKQIKRFWRRSIFRDRRLYSEYYTIYQDLRDTDFLGTVKYRQGIRVNIETTI